MNTGEPEYAILVAERRVLEIQSKLHRWFDTGRRDLWRARCGESRTPGSGGDSEKPTSGDTGRALRVDLTESKSCVRLLPRAVAAGRWC